jgi:hypothetical protein
MILNLRHEVYDSKDGNLMERVAQYIKDRAKPFDDYIRMLKEGAIENML